MVVSDRELLMLRRLQHSGVQHLQFNLTERNALKRLWLRGYIRLAVTNVWHLSAKGRFLLDCGGVAH